MTLDAAVHTESLTKRYGNVAAVNGVNLTIPQGVAFGYLGPNGAGKTTLIRMLLGLTPATSGRMWLLGEEIPKHRAVALAQVGAIVEEPRFYPYLTGLENLLIASAVRGPESKGRIKQTLDRVGLSEVGNSKVSTYSLGMRQRLGIARCLLNDPKLLVLDEPMNGLDPAGILEFRLLIRSLVDEGRTVVISSHLLDEVEKTCDAIAIVDHGQVVRQGTLAEVTGIHEGVVILEVNPVERALEILGGLTQVISVEVIARNELKVSLNQTTKISKLNQILVRAGVEVERLEPKKATLEDEFLAVTSNMGIK